MKKLLSFALVMLLGIGAISGCDIQKKEEQVNVLTIEQGNQIYNRAYLKLLFNEDGVRDNLKFTRETTWNSGETNENEVWFYSDENVKVYYEVRDDEYLLYDEGEGLFEYRSNGDSTNFISNSSLEEEIYKNEDANLLGASISEYLVAVEILENGNYQLTSHQHNDEGGVGDVISYIEISQDYKFISAKSIMMGVSSDDGEYVFAKANAKFEYGALTETKVSEKVDFAKTKLN